MAVSDYSLTPSLNTTISGIFIGENMARSDVNNAMRQMMADTKAAITVASLATVALGVDATQIVTPATHAQSIQSGSFLYGATGGSATVATLTLVPPPSVLTIGMEVLASITTTNTGALTLNVNGLGPKSVVIAGNALTAGMWTAGRILNLVYDGTSWQIVTPPVTIVAYGSNANGNWELYSNGKIEQWGSAAFTSGGSTASAAVTFPIAFTAIPLVTGTGQGKPNSSSGVFPVYTDIPTFTTVQFNADTSVAGQVFTSGKLIKWRATGS